MDQIKKPFFKEENISKGKVSKGNKSRYYSRTTGNFENSR